MCQPGRPGPHGLSHAGSPGLAAFQSAKSSGLRFCSPTSMRAPDLRSSMLLPGELAVAREAADAVVDVAARRVGEAAVLQRLTMSIISAMCSVASGSTSAAPRPAPRRSSFMSAV